MEKLSLHINYKIPIIAIVILCLAAGMYSFFHIPTSLYPNVNFPKIKIILQNGQEPVDKMIATVTIPLEAALSQTEGVESIRSITNRGTCELSVFLNWESDVNIAKQQIESKVATFISSSGTYMDVRVEKMSPSTLPVMIYSIDGHSDPTALRNIAEYQIKPIIAEVEGVSEVKIVGGKTKEYRIEVKPERLSELAISLTQIQAAILQENIYQSNGYVRDHNRMYISITNNEIENTEELKNLVIVNGANRLIQLKDIANLYLAEANEQQQVIANGKEIPLIEIMKQTEANVITVQKNIEQKVKESNSYLPKGIILHPVYQQADFEIESISNMQYALWIGLALSFIIVLLFLRSFAATAAVYISIPFTMTLSLLVLYLVGYSFNVMTLGAIAASIGLLLDDAILVVEQIHKSREEFPNRTLSENIKLSIRYLLPAMLASSVTSIIIFIPYYILSDSAGAYFHVLANTMIICLICSFLVVWWITPVLFAMFIHKNTIQKAFIVASSNWIHVVLKTPFLAIGILGIGLFLLLFLPAKLSTGFLPEMDEGSIFIDYESPSGTDLQETIRLTQQLDKFLLSIPDIASFSRRTGIRSGLHVSKVNRGDYLIQLKPSKKQSTAYFADTIRKWTKQHLPALQTDFGQPMSNTLNDLMHSLQPVEIKIFGDDPAKLENIAKEIAANIQTIQGVVDVKDGVVLTGPAITIQPNVPLLAQLGLYPSDFQFQLQTQTDGSIVSTVIDREQQLNVRLLYPKTYQTNIQDVQKSMIWLPGGALKPLQSLATTSIQAGEVEVHRENLQKMISITARLNRSDIGGVFRDLQQKINHSILLPQGYHLVFGGSYTHQKQSFRELLLIFLLGTCGVFLVVLFLFRKLYVAFSASLLSIVSVAGSLLLLYITDTPLNIASYTGIIMVTGIIAENIIFTNLLFIEASKKLNYLASIQYAVAGRLRPKIMMVLTSIITLLPLAFNFGNASLVYQPLAIAVIGGMLFALPLLLIVWPVMQMYLAKKIFTEKK